MILGLSKPSISCLYQNIPGAIIAKLKFNTDMSKRRKGIYIQWLNLHVSRFYLTESCREIRQTAKPTLKWSGSPSIHESVLRRATSSCQREHRGANLFWVKVNQFTGSCDANQASSYHRKMAYSLGVHCASAAASFKRVLLSSICQYRKLLWWLSVSLIHARVWFMRLHGCARPTWKRLTETREMFEFHQYPILCSWHFNDNNNKKIRPSINSSIYSTITSDQQLINQSINSLNFGVVQVGSIKN